MAADAAQQSPAHHPSKTINHAHWSHLPPHPQGGAAAVSCYGTMAALDMWYGLSYSYLLADAAIAAASMQYDNPPRAKRRKLEAAAAVSTSSASEVKDVIVTSTNTRLTPSYESRRGSVTFKPYSDIRLDSSLQRLSGRGEARQPLKRRHGDNFNPDQNYADSIRKRLMYGPGVGNNTQVVQQEVGCTIGNLFPEILSMIFEYLDVQSKGRVAQVSTRWRDAAYKKSVWKGIEAKLHLNRSNATLYASLVGRGIKKVQVLSLRKSLSDLVKGIPDLESLNLSGCYNLSDNELAFNKEIPKLKTLNLSLCKEVTDHSLGRIATNCKNLEAVDLAGCSKITNNGLLYVSWGLKKLKRLNLRSCRQISDQGIGYLCGVDDAPHPGSLMLEDLSLQDCQKLSDESLRHISQGLPSLRSLNLSFCVSITDTGLKSLAKMASLREINLRSCDNVSDIGIGFLAEPSENSNPSSPPPPAASDAAASSNGNGQHQRHLPLQRLDVSFCGNVTDASLRHIATGLISLRSLSMTTCAITDGGLAKLANNLSGLEELNIGQCVNVSDEGLTHLAASEAKMSCLSSIDLYGCPRITETAVSKLKSKLPKLTKLNLSL